MVYEYFPKNGGISVEESRFLNLAIKSGPARLPFKDTLLASPELQRMETYKRSIQRFERDNLVIKTALLRGFRAKYKKK